MRKKILYGTMCIALSVMLIGCNSKSDNSANSNSTSDIAQTTETTNNSSSIQESTNDATPKDSNVDVKDVASMTYDEAASYLDTLPENSSSDFSIIKQGENADYENLISDGECFISEYTGDAPIVIVPSEIDGCKVVGIGQSAFLSKEMTAVKLPDTVKTIEKDAFNLCSSLSIITGLDNVESLGSNCFSTCSALRIKFTDSVKESAAMIYLAYGEVYVKTGSFMANDDNFGGYDANNESNTFKVIFY